MFVCLWVQVRITVSFRTIDEPFHIVTFIGAALTYPCGASTSVIVYSSKRKPCKRHHAIPPACGFLGYAVAADLKLNAFKRLPIVALLDERQRVFFQCILYCRFYVPVIVSAYLERPYGFIQCITVGRSNFLNIIRSGRQICKQRLAVFVGLLNINRLFGGGSVLIKPEKSPRKRLVAIGLGYAYAALYRGCFSMSKLTVFASKADSFWQVVYGIRSTVSLVFPR